ncbi:MAG: DUF2029 domain-containing protein [Planctomycetes bacterium]|nr:DUF2029 domain-containing protein [Planctomycetota bacterium]
MSQRARSLLVLLVGGAVLLFAADTVVRTPGFLMPRDFLEYWAAGRVNLRAGNPYHPDELLAEQQLADPAREHAVMMWNPPSALAVYMPLGAFPPRWAALLWAGLQFVSVFAACDLLWRVYCPAWSDHSVTGFAGSGHGVTGPRQGHRWCAAGVAISFVGTWWLVAYGQNTGFILLGLAGFLHFRRRGMPLAAGACAALTALKPHLLACFGVLLVADVVTRRGAKALVAGAAVVALALGAAVAANPSVIGQFVEAARRPAEGAIPLSAWMLPVPAYWLRVWLAPGHFWVQFVPCAVACTGALAYRVWKGAAFDWQRALPLVVAASLIATPYGGWIFDLPVLLVPVVWAAARLVGEGRFALAAALVCGQAAITAASFVWVGALHAYWWVAPAALALCVPAVGRVPRS